MVLRKVGRDYERIISTNLIVREVFPFHTKYRVWRYFSFSLNHLQNTDNFKNILKLSVIFVYGLY